LRRLARWLICESRSAIAAIACLVSFFFLHLWIQLTYRLAGVNPRKRRRGQRLSVTGRMILPQMKM
jgi:hypothetical protein